VIGDEQIEKGREKVKAVCMYMYLMTPGKGTKIIPLRPTPLQIPRSSKDASPQPDLLVRKIEQQKVLYCSCSYLREINIIGQSKT
jgi:hypothetical protein